MIARRLLLVASILFGIQTTNAQQTITLKGKIVDKTTSEPLAFATISIAGTRKGVVSNFLGVFEFALKNAKQHDTLQVSMLGYATYLVPIRSVANPAELIINLEEKVILLQEVVVNDKELSPKEIVEKVIENIPNNYPTTPYLLKGFTRAHKKECDKYVSLFEANFDLYGRGYNTKSKIGTPEKIFLNEMRASRKVDQYKVPAMEISRNPFVALRHINDVLLKTFSLNTSRNTYHLENYTTLNDQLVYVIVTGKDDGRMGHKNRMYIDVENYALIKVDYEINTPPDEDWNPALMKGPTIGPTKDSLLYKVKRVAKSVQFENINGLYFLKYTNWHMGGDILDKHTNEVLCDWGARFEMMFSDATIDNVERPSKKLLLKPKGGKDPRVEAYNETFWNNYDLIREFPLTDQIEIDLSQEKDLQTQFRERAKKGT